MLLYALNQSPQWRSVQLLVWLTAAVASNDSCETIRYHCRHPTSCFAACPHSSSTSSHDRRSAKSQLHRGRQRCFAPPVYFHLTIGALAHRFGSPSLPQHIPDQFLQSRTRHQLCQQVCNLRFTALPGNPKKKGLILDKNSSSMYALT